MISRQPQLRQLILRSRYLSVSKSAAVFELVLDFGETIIAHNYRLRQVQFKDKARAASRKL